MSTAFKKVAVFVLAVTMIGMYSSVNAQSTTDLQAQITALLSQINQLQSQLASQSSTTTTSSGSSYNYTRDLTLGSRGDDVTALQQMLINGGYLTAVSAPTGYFGPLTQASLAKFQAAKGINPPAGYFGPITRAYLASMSTTTTTTTTTTSNYPAGCTSSAGFSPTTGHSCSSGVVTTTVGGSFSVSLASDNPGSMSVAVNPSSPSGAAELVPVLKLNFSGGASDVTVTGLNVMRGGLSADQDLSNVYLMDGSHVLTTNIGMNNGTVQFQNPAGLFTVRAGTTKEITVAISIVSTTASGHTYQFSVPSASSITAGSATVGGSFPIVGNIMSSATVSNLGGVTITNGSSGNNTSGTGLTVNAGTTQFLAGQFTVQANNQAIQVKSLAFTMTASLQPSDLGNITLFNGVTSLGTATIGANNQVVFDLSSNPLQLTSGQTSQLYLYADVNGGVNRYFQFSIQHNYDIVAQDMMFNIGTLPTLNTLSFPLNLAYVNVQQGTMTLTRDTASPVNYLLPGGTNQTIAKFDFAAAGEAVRITNLQLRVDGTNGFGAAQVTNLKAVDDQGTQIGTTFATISALGDQTAYSNLNYLIPANTTRVVSVIADVASTATGTLTATVKGVSGQGYTSLAAVPTSGSLSSTGNQLSASTALLTAALNSALSSANVVSGQIGAKVASFTLTAGAASAVQVSNFTFAYGSNAATLYQNVVVKNGSTQIGTTQSSPVNSGSFTVTAGSPITISAGGQLILDIYADAKTGLSVTTSTAVTLNSVSALATATNQSITSVTGLPSLAGQTSSIVAAGTLAYAGYNMPAATQVGMGTTGVKLATYQLTGSTAEAITVNNVWLKSTSTLTGLFTNFRLMVGSQQYGGNLNLTGVSSPYTLEWTGVNIPVGVGGSVYVDVLADANSYGNLSGVYTSTTTAPSATVNVSQLDYQGSASSNTQSVTSTTYSSAFTALRTTLNAATGSGVTYGGSYSNYLVGVYSFTAGSGNGATLNSVNVGLLINNASTSNTTTTISVYDPSLGQTVSAAGATTTVAGATSTLTLTGETLTPGQTKLLYVYANVNNFTTKPASSNSSITAQVNLTSWNWSDGQVLSIGPAASYNLPTNAIPGSTNPVTIVQ